MNTLHEAVDDYLELRRGLGYKMRHAALLLPRFVKFMDERQAIHITTQLALQWAQAPSVKRAESAQRLCVVRGFARYRSASDILTEIPQRDLLPYRCSRAKPYLYSEEEVQCLLDAALRLPTAWPSTPLRPWVFHCLLGLLTVTGLRISEAMNLQVDDLNLEEAVLKVRAAKLGRWRLVPIHSSTCTAMAEYLDRRTRFFDRPISQFVFVNRCGNRLDIGHVHRTFYALSRQVGLRAPDASKGPRIHDFRHRFALQSLMRWYESGQDPAQRLPVLSTYLGHVCVACTYWYLTSSPQLMTHAMARLERRWGDPS